jgi:hypothetical protein
VQEKFFSSRSLLSSVIIRSRESLAAEVLFLRRQRALYRERGVKPKRVDAATRVALTFLSCWFDWRSASSGARDAFTRRGHGACLANLNGCCRARCYCRLVSRLSPCHVEGWIMASQRKDVQSLPSAQQLVGSQKPRDMEESRAHCRRASMRQTKRNVYGKR